MAKGQDRRGREAKKPKAAKKVASGASTFLRPQTGDKPAPPKTTPSQQSDKKP